MIDIFCFHLVISCLFFQFFFAFSVIVMEAFCGQNIEFAYIHVMLHIPGAGQKTPEIFVYASSNEK